MNFGCTKILKLLSSSLVEALVVMTTELCQWSFKPRLSFPRRNFHACAESPRLSGTFFHLAVKKSEGERIRRTSGFTQGFQFRKQLQRPLERREMGGTMKSQLKFALLLALGTGVLSAGAAAQERQVNVGDNGRLQYATFNSSQAAELQQVGWNDRRRCDGDHDRDDRGCYYQYRNQYPVYYGNGYYGNGYYVAPAPAPYYPPNRGWYDRNGRWHAYDRDRDRDRRRHDDDDRR
jgi:hypothetical protein